MGTGGSRNGAGRPSWHTRADRCLKLNVADLKRHGVLQRAGYVGWRWKNTDTGEEIGAIGLMVSPMSALRLNFTTNGNNVAQYIPLQHTACNYGGTRAWLSCPECRRRVGVLFLRGGRFVCRHCGQVAYASQSDDALGTTWRTQARLERRLSPNLARPKGMHHSTHERLCAAILDCYEAREAILAVFLEHFNLQLARLSDKIKATGSRPAA
jgi:hypothetical protein